MVNLPFQFVLAISLLQAGMTAPCSADGETSRAAKPWLDDPSAYFGEHADRRWVIGHSSIGCLSAAEAFDTACLDASRQLASLDASAAPSAAIPSDRFVRRIAAEMDAGHLIRDKYFATIEKPYGELWTAAVLVDASDDALRRIASDEIAAQRQRHIAGVHRIAMIGGLCGATLLVYAGLNAMTLGYFQGRLRFGAAACMLGIMQMVHMGWTG